MKSIVSIVLFLFLLCVLHGTACAILGLDSVEFLPPHPLSSETIEVTLSGLWPDSCVPNDITVTVVEDPIDQDTIYIDAVQDYPPGTGCWAVGTLWELSAIFGPLEPGVYNVEVQVGESGYQTFPALAVGLPVVYTCQVDPNESVLTQSGGFAGIYEEYDVDGEFLLIHDPENNQAWLTRVEVFSLTSGWLPTTDLDELLNLSGLESTSVTTDGTQFFGQTDDIDWTPEADVTLEAVIYGDIITLSGMTDSPWPDSFNYELYVTGIVIDDPACTKFPLADVNRDCRVNLIDYVLIASEWMQCNLVPSDSCH